MAFDISMAFIAAAVVTLTVFLVISLLKLIKILNQTLILMENLNQAMPSVLTDLQDISSNANIIVGTVTQGVQKTAGGIQYLNSLKLTTITEFFMILRKGLRILKTMLKRRKKDEQG